MKICFVGGTGNISSSIVRKLLELGHEITVYNRGETNTAQPGVRHIKGGPLKSGRF